MTLKIEVGQKATSIEDGKYFTKGREYQIVAVNIGNVTLIDDVRVTRAGVAGKPETTLTTARMDVWPDDELAKSTLPVTITQGASRLRGEGGMSVDQKSLIYALEGPVEGVFFRTAATPASTRTARPAPASRSAAPPKAGAKTKSKPSSSRR